MQHCSGKKRRIASWENAAWNSAMAAVAAVRHHLANCLSRLFARLELPTSELKAAVKQEVADSKAIEELEISMAFMGP